MRSLIPSLELARRVTDVAVAYTLARMRILERIPGNPIGVEIRISGNVAALMARHLPSPAFNSVVGLRSGEAEHVAALVEWYRANDVAGRFEISAADNDPAVGQELARLGYFQSGFHAALVGVRHEDVEADRGIAIDPVTSSAEMEEFLSAYVAGRRIPPALHEQFKQNVRPWLGAPGWTLYLARVDGHAAAAAILFMHEGVGYLADAATAPPFRGRGLHAALLRRRLRDAEDAGAAFACSGADFLSTSHRNMERAGMRLLFLRAIWTPLD